MRTLFTTLSLAALLGAHAQSIRIAEFATDDAGGPSPAVAMGGKLYFSAYDSEHGRELWTTDGTSEGTYMVKDIRPGLGSSLSYFELLSIAIGEVLYFRANDGVTGSELWRSDGTEAGTVLVKDIQAGEFDSGPGVFTDVNGMLFFTAYTGTQLWRSNGTSNGTQLVRNFTVASSLYAHQGTLYFAGDPDNSGQELWKSNGTFNTTERVKDLNGVFGASLPINFHSAGDLLYFDASTDTGWELWRTDGTQEGTQPVKDINPGAANGTLVAYSNIVKTNIGDTLYFRADDGVHGHQLWRTNGTEASTVRVSNLPDPIDPYCEYPIVGGKVLVNNYFTDHWWAYDPATDTTLVSGYPSASYLNSWDTKYVFSGTTMFYAGKDTAFGCELWRADGTDGDEHRTQETHFTDNWSSNELQPFTTIIGTLNGSVIFMQARSAYDFKVGLFRHDPLIAACAVPMSALSVPVENAGLHVIFDRQAEYGHHEVRYRTPGTETWEITTTGTGYAALDVDADQPWEYQVRSECDDVWTDWSALFLHDPVQDPIDPYVGASILADRGENATTMRIYWTRTDAYTHMQMRYRPYATPDQPWSMASNATGMRRLTDLSPETLYTYDFRFNDGTDWTPWSYSSLYFATQNPDFPTGVSAEARPTLGLSPNPATDVLCITGSYDASRPVRILDGTGRLVREGTAVGGRVQLHGLAPGSYVLEIGKEVRQRARFLKL